MRCRPAGSVDRFARENHGALEELIAGVAGSRLRLELIEREEAGEHEPETEAETGAASRDRPPARAARDESDYAEHPLVSRAMELFDARIVNVKPKPPSGEASQS